MKRLLIAMLALTFTASLFAQPKGYYSYRNEKYEYSVLIPDAFDGMGESASGDGQTFVSPDGDAHLQAYGGYNAQTLLGTSFDEEFQSKLQELKNRKVNLLDQGTMDDPDGEFDLAYVIKYVEDGLFHALRTIWWDDHFATVAFWCYQDDWAQYEETGCVDGVLYSLWPDDGMRLSEADKVSEWAAPEDCFIHVYPDGAGAQPNIKNFFHGFATSFQTNLTMAGLNKIGNPDYNDEEIAEWILDNQNNYMTLQLVSNEDYWMEACVFDKENGHKLFVVNYHAPNQRLLCFDYNPEQQTASVDHQTLELLQRMPKAIVRLPRQGTTMDVYYYKDLSKPVGHLTWNGHGFDFTQK